MIAAENLDALNETQLRQTVQLLMTELHHKTALVDKLTHEMAVLKRLKFAAKSEAYTPEQNSLIEEALDADLAALAAEIEIQQPTKPAPEDPQQPKREKLPAHLPRREIRHEPEDTACDDAQCLAMLVRRKGETLDALLQRLDAAINDAYENERFIDEVNVPTTSSARKPRR